MRAQTPESHFGSVRCGVPDHFGCTGEPGPPGGGTTGVRPTFGGAGFVMFGSTSPGGQTTPPDWDNWSLGLFGCGAPLGGPGGLPGPPEKH
jgi:hypothetical protein